MVVSNLFLWYDEGQDLFSERKNLQFLFQNVSKKEEKTERQVMQYRFKYIDWQTAGAAAPG